jgi:integrase/recombinase XerD
MIDKDFKNYLIAKGYAASTAQGILRDVNYFLQWLQPQNIEIEQVNYNDITAYLNTFKKRDTVIRTQQCNLINIKHYLNYLVQADILTHNPVVALKLKNTKRKTLYHIFTNEELESMYKNYQTEIKKHLIAPPQQANELARKRNKVMLGLIVYQGLNAEDLHHVEVTHLQLREGKIHIVAKRRSNERTLPLQPNQIFELYDYINETRKAILQHTKQQTNKLIVAVRTSSSIQNALQLLIASLKKENPRVKNLDQLRASVITNWLKQYNKRKVQYMAGHRYVSSTEAYEANNIEALQEDVEKYYPVI